MTKLKLKGPRGQPEKRSSSKPPNKAETNDFCQLLVRLTKIIMTKIKLGKTPKMLK